MPRLFHKKPEPIPKPTGVLPAGRDPADWVTPVAQLRLGLRIIEPWVFVHKDDAMVARRPDLFIRHDGQPVGPEPPKSAHSNSL